MGANKSGSTLGSGGRDAYRYAMHDETDRDEEMAWRLADSDWAPDMALARRLQLEENALEEERRRLERLPSDEKRRRREEQMRRDEEMARAIANEGTRRRLPARDDERLQSDEELARRLQAQWQ